MKIKIAMKYVINNYKRVWRCGYCDLQYIMNRDDPTFYNAGVYGWNCDVYVDHETNTAITTGYRNMRGERIPDEVIAKYSDAAKKIKASYSAANYNEMQAALEANKRAFYNELAAI
jgi:hypothetical protein